MPRYDFPEGIDERPLKTHEKKLLNQVALLSLLNQCQKYKNNKQNVTYVSDRDSDSDYEPPKKKKGKKGKKKKRKESNKIYKKTEKSIAKIRNGVIEIDEEKYLKSLTKKQLLKYNKSATKIYESVKNTTPLVFRILDWPCNPKTKALICEKFNAFSNMQPGEGEYAKLNSWITDLEQLPIGINVKLPVAVDNDTPEVISEFLTTARYTLDSAVFGHNSAKDDIIRVLAQWIRNPNSPTQAIAIQGQMGVGKTTLVKNGIAKVMNRPFSFISMGGAHDSSFLDGFEYTYEGARPGRIVDSIKNAGCMNPVIFLDELDKISNTDRGKEIQNTLIHLLDGAQNTHFQDKYFSGIDLDLSRAVFVLSFNDSTNIDKILLDRIKVIETKGFNIEDKLKIATQFLIPEVLKQVGLNKEVINLTNNAIKKIINQYTKSEEGVRNLKRAIHTIISEVNLKRFINHKNKEPTNITEENIDTFLKNYKIDHSPCLHMYS